jgi:NADH:ubiquinone oxidoreductase subunit 6 (subunit J)
MSVTIVLALVFALAVLVLTIFVAVVVGIRSEPRNQMTTQAHRPLAALVRRLLGVYVSKTTEANAADNRGDCLTGNSASRRNKGGWDR